MFTIHSHPREFPAAIHHLKSTLVRCGKRKQEDNLQPPFLPPPPKDKRQETHKIPALVKRKTH